MSKKIAIVGGGAKAAAICAKAACLGRRHAGSIEVTVFERSQVGANWSGQHGYTDGRQRLCTPAERDLGFPYEAGLLDSTQVGELFGSFSWGAYQIAQSPRGRYLDWVNRGRNPPTHAEFASYLDWAIRKSGATLRIAEVTGIDLADGNWVIRARSSGRSARYSGFDGLVITGPGRPRQSLGHTDHPHVTDGMSFWLRPAEFLRPIQASDDPIVIIGAGGTAAAIAGWIVRHTPSPRPVFIIGDQAALFTRPDGFFENILFSDEEAWLALAPSVRADFTRRLNRGVVWATVSEALALSGSIRFVPGIVEDLSRIAAPGAGEPDEITVAYRDHGGAKQIPASLVIDGSGFDAWWFASLLPAHLQAQIVDSNGETQKQKRQGLSDAIRRDLSLPLDGLAPLLHAPMLSQSVGPGFLSLMVLGSMSDRVLGAYV